MTGIELIAKEREEQINKHGRSVEHDALENTNFQLTYAATVLIFTPEEHSPLEVVLDFGKLDNWNLDILDKMVNKSYKERLIISGALIAAELDRLNYIENNTNKI